MALHEQAVGATDEWYTPPRIFNAMGCSFDVDVASPGKPITPWIPAFEFITEKSLEAKWGGYIWMNPPFGGRNGLIPWLKKFIAHGNGIALVPDRTSAPWWQAFVPYVDLVLFVAPKIKFVNAKGQPGKSPAQGTCLAAIGSRANEALWRATSNCLGVIMEKAHG
jgi:hypothetical protein